MTQPARESAAESVTEQEQARKLDPRKLIWAEVSTTIAVCTHAARLAVTELAHRPDDDPALAMARVTLRAFENAVGLGRQWVVSEAVLDEVDRRAYERGVADCKAARCHLELLDGGQPG